MTDISTYVTGGLPPITGEATTWNPTALVNMRAGTPVNLSIDPDSIGQVIPASAVLTPQTLQTVVGFCAFPATAGLAVNCKYAGPLTLTVAQWAAITGNPAGLVAGNAYYIDPAAPGKITLLRTNSPSALVIGVGVSVSPVTLFIQINGPLPTSG